MLSSSSTSFSKGSRGHISTKRILDSGCDLPFTSMGSFSCWLAFCCVVMEDVDLTVSDSLSSFRVWRRLTGPSYLPFPALVSWLLQARRVSGSEQGHFGFPGRTSPIRTILILKFFSAWLVVHTVCTSEQLFKAGVAKARNDMALVLGDETTLQGFMNLEQVYPAVDCIVHRQQLVEAYN